VYECSLTFNNLLSAREKKKTFQNLRVISAPLNKEILFLKGESGKEIRMI